MPQGMNTEQITKVGNQGGNHPWPKFLSFWIAPEQKQNNPNWGDENGQNKKILAQKKNWRRH